MSEHHSHRGQRSRGSGVSRFVFFGFLAVAAYFLISEHRAHVVPLLPFVLLALCPLLHLFHHRGHGGETDEKRTAGPGAEPPRDVGGGGHRH